MSEEKILLGFTKKELTGESRRIYLTDFSWDCGWYWGGGYIGNRDLHCHFDGCFLNTPDVRGHPLGNFITPWSEKPKYGGKFIVLCNGCSIWEPLSTFLDKPVFDVSEWWRIKDLFKQFYKLRDAAEVFRHGGHCSSDGRNPEELNSDMENRINSHIETVIIPEIRKICKFKSENPKRNA